MATLTIKKEQTLPGAPIASWGASFVLELPKFAETVLNKGFMSGSFEVSRLPNGNLEMTLKNS